LGSGSDPNPLVGEVTLRIGCKQVTTDSLRAER